MFKKVLGRTNINNTMVYVTLAEELFKDQQECVSKVADDVKEACALVDSSFEYVTGEYRDGGKIFRKPRYALHQTDKLHYVFNILVRGVRFTLSFNTVNWHYH